MVFGLASLTSWNCPTSINDRLVAASETKETSLFTVYLGCILASRLLQPTSYHYISITGFGMKCPYVWGLLFLFACFQWPPAAHGRLRSSSCLAADSAFLWYDPIGSALYTVHLAFCDTQKSIWYMINVRFSCPKSQNHHPLTSQLTSCHLCQSNKTPAGPVTAKPQENPYDSVELVLTFPVTPATASKFSALAESRQKLPVWVKGWGCCGGRLHERWHQNPTQFQMDTQSRCHEGTEIGMSFL